MMSAREIGEPERKGASETESFQYRPCHEGSYSDLAIKVFDDRTDVDVTSTYLANTTVTNTSGVLSTAATKDLRAEMVLRVHFIFKVNNVAYDEYRRVIVEK